jgi:hypothetical protein
MNSTNVSENNLPVAVLFLVFNRPYSTAKVFEAIRSARPARLYVASDGPREDRPGEAEIVKNVRSLADQVDWPCEVKTLFRDKNIGCKVAVSTAISWFFESEIEGIILEDDCLPGLDFFQYCKELLEKYRHDERVGLICGTNLYNLNSILPHDKSEESYYFGRTASIWGWATWRRVWDEYDVDISDWAELKKFKSYRHNFSPRKWRFLCKTFDTANLNKIDTWDYQFGYLLLKSGRLCATPNVNLIKNIGFNASATHTKNKFAHEGENQIENIAWPLRHPIGMFVDNLKDNYLDLVYSSKLIRYLIVIIKLAFKWKARESLQKSAS